MILEYRIDELSVQDAWLTTLYELVEELNCKCQTYFDEAYNSKHKCYSQTRIIKVRGSSPMLGWLKLRMERYMHFINSLNSQADFISSTYLEDEAS